MATRRQAANMETGEVLQLEMFDAGPKKKPVRYTWRGRHINVSKELHRQVWRKDSGYDIYARDVLGYYLFNAGENAEPLRESFRQMADTLGYGARIVARAVRQLNAGGLLLDSGEGVAKTKFYRVNARIAYDGSAESQVEAVANMRHPVVPAPAKKESAR